MPRNHNPAAARHSPEAAHHNLQEVPQEEVMRPQEEVAVVRLQAVVLVRLQEREPEPEQVPAQVLNRPLSKTPPFPSPHAPAESA